MLSATIKSSLEKLLSDGNFNEAFVVWTSRDSPAKFIQTFGCNSREIVLNVVENDVNGYFSESQLFALASLGWARSVDEGSNRDFFQTVGVDSPAALEEAIAVIEKTFLEVFSVSPTDDIDVELHLGNGVLQ